MSDKVVSDECGMAYCHEPPFGTSRWCRKHRDYYGQDLGTRPDGGEREQPLSGQQGAASAAGIGDATPSGAAPANAASSYLSAEQIDAIGSLAVRTDLASHLADVVIACAWTTGQAPREMLARLAESYKIDDETWRTVVAPELSFALGEEAAS